MRIRFQLVHLSLAAGFAVAMCAIVVITTLGAERQNQQYLATQSTIADAEIADMYTYLRGQVRQMVYWQDAYDNTVRRWNSNWVTYQFGAYQDTMGNHHVAMLSGNREVRFFHAPAGEKNLSRDTFRNAKGLKALYNKVLALGVKQPTPMVAGVIVAGNRPYFAVAALMTPETKEDLAAANRAPVAAIFFRPIALADFDEFAVGLDQSQLLVTAAQGVEGDYRYHALKDTDGVPVAWLRWAPLMPGTEFMRQVSVPIVIALAVFMLILVVVAGRWLALQKKLLRTQVEARTANEQNRLKSVFLGTISHELRTPLNAIIGYADTLCCQIFGPLGDPRNTEYVRDIRTSGHHLLKMVNDLIEIARIEARDACDDIEAFDTAEAARKAITALQQRIQEKDLRISLIRSEQPVVCRGSQVSLARALERILSNAIRHSPRAGAIEIELRHRRNEVEIEIRDHGEGISPERLADLQRPFGHPDNHLVSGKGFGFGIPIAKGLIGLMHGRFDIESSDAGTTVRMSLPADRAKAIAVEQNARQIRRAG